MNAEPALRLLNAESSTACTASLLALVIHQSTPPENLDHTGLAKPADQKTRTK